MDVIIINNIDLKLKKLGRESFYRQSKKNQDRLLNIEKYINENYNMVDVLVEKLRGLNLTKSKICDSLKTSFSRKTMYNEKILEEYIDLSIKEQKDIFNEKVVKQKIEIIDELTEQYNKLLNNHINEQLYKIKIKEYNMQLVNLRNEIDNLKEIISDKNKEIMFLKRGSAKNINNISNI